MSTVLIKQAVRFVIVGIAATAIPYGVYLLLRKWMGENIAFTIGYVISFIFNYLLTSLFTFKKKANLKNGIGFSFAHLINYSLQIGLLNLFLWLGINAKICPIPVYCIAVPLNFVMVKFVFTKIKRYESK